MCGIAGFISFKEFDKVDYINNVVKSIHHRGPDECGNYINNNVCLINTRLSIIDVSNGKQPIINEEEDVVVVQNGEIYNFIEIREELKSKGASFNTKSDTEVILRAYEIFGTDCFELFNGMFSIAIFDKCKKKVILGRDRLGVKPLYLYEREDEIHFSSEIKSFLSITDFDKSINNQSIHNYLKFNYIPIPQTIFKYVSHIEPGTYIEIDTVSLVVNRYKYWQIENVKENSNISEEDIFEQMDVILTDAIKIRLRSDVGVGAFLSGGLDSSLVCAMTKKNFDVSLETYTIGFKEEKFDESKWAKKVADYCEIDNNVQVLDSNIIELWNKTTWFNDQPHGDISFIPTYILSEFASKDYKLVFTGDGGDEAFAGYTKYFNALDGNEKDYFDTISLIKDDKVFDELYNDNFKSKVDYKAPFDLFKNVISEVSNKDFVNKILHFDTRQLLPGNNLVKPDKMAMANSLESRSPLLDYRLFELCQSLKGSYKLRGGETKYILKKFALKYLPHDVVYREKQMFTVPVGEWFKTHLKGYIVNIINSNSLKERNIFNVGFLKIILNDHINEKHDYTRELRAIVNLELWFRRFIDKT